MRNLTVYIPKPCHERWEEMSPVDRGRFCASCQKTVVDYSALSDRELAKALSQLTTGACGRLSDDQLNRPLVVPKSRATSVWHQLAGLVTMTLLGWQSAWAQKGSIRSTSLRPAMANQATRPAYDVAALPIRPKANTITEWVVTGRVMFSDSSGASSPLEGASVHAKLGDHSWTTRTDSLGFYQVKVPVQVPGAALVLQAFWLDRRYPVWAKDTVDVTSTNLSVSVNDIILRKPLYAETIPRTITGGGLMVVKSPSRWQRMKRSLFGKRTTCADSE